MYVSEEPYSTANRCQINGHKQNIIAEQMKDTRTTSISDTKGEVRVFEGKAPERGKLPFPTRRRVGFTGLLDMTLFSSL